MGTFPGGAVLQGGSCGWVLAENDAERSLGRALAWAERASAEELHLIVDDEAAVGLVARRAAAFTRPLWVWRVDANELQPAQPAPVGPVEPPPDERGWADLIREAGAQPVLEREGMVAEVAGLEVARVIVDHEGAYLEVGVGKHDRHARRLLWADVPTRDALAAAVETVKRHRREGAPPHPLNRLSPERRLRTRVVADPGLVGAIRLGPVPATTTRTGLRVPASAPAAGEGCDGEPVVVVCSVGVDLELVPAAADVRAATDPTARLLLVLPERDDHPTTRSLAGALVEPAEVIALGSPPKVAGEGRSVA